MSHAKNKAFRYGSLLIIGLAMAATAQAEPTLNLHRPIYIGASAYGCLTPDDLPHLTMAGMDIMDAGGIFLTCRKWPEGDPVRVIGKDKSGTMLDVVPIDRGNDIGGWDSWFFDSDLKN